MPIHFQSVILESVKIKSVGFLEDLKNDTFESARARAHARIYIKNMKSEVQTITSNVNYLVNICI